MTASQVARALKNQGFETEVLADNIVLTSLSRRISVMEVRRAWGIFYKYMVQTTDGKVKIHI